MLGGFFFFSDKKKKSPMTPKRKMTGKEGVYPVFPLYNHPSKKNGIVCKTNLPVFLTNFSLRNSVSVAARMPLVPRSSEFLLPQKLALKSVQGGTLLRESLKAGLNFRVWLPALGLRQLTGRLNPLKQV